MSNKRPHPKPPENSEYFVQVKDLVIDEDGCERDSYGDPNEFVFVEICPAIMRHCECGKEKCLHAYYRSVSAIETFSEDDRPEEFEDYIRREIIAAVASREWRKIGKRIDEECDRAQMDSPSGDLARNVLSDFVRRSHEARTHAREWDQWGDGNWENWYAKEE